MMGVLMNRVMGTIIFKGGHVRGYCQYPSIFRSTATATAPATATATATAAATATTTTNDEDCWSGNLAPG